MIVVVGGGIAGLACGHRLKALGAPVVVLESADRPGGKMATEAAPGGYLLERGPQTVLVGPGLRALAAEAGVAVVERGKRDRARYLVRGGRLRSPLRAISARGVVRAAWGMIRKGAPPEEDESVEAYARRRFGDEAARRVFDPLVSGIYAGDPRRLSWLSALARFGERRGASASFAGGLGALPMALAARLGSSLRLGARVEAIEPRGPGAPGYRVRLEGAEALLADRVVVTCPSFEAARLLEGADRALAEALRAIPYAAVTAVALGYPVSAFPGGVPRGFGFLAAREEGLPILGCLFCPAPEGKVLLRAFVRGVAGDAPAVARRSVEEVLSIRGAPEVSRAFPHAEGIPQYELGHARRLRLIDERLRGLPGISLAGNAYRGVAVGDVVEEAERVARAIAGAEGSAFTSG